MRFDFLDQLWRFGGFTRGCNEFVTCAEDGAAKSQAETGGAETQPTGGETQRAAAAIERKAVEGDQPKIGEVHPGGFATHNGPDGTVENRDQRECGSEVDPELFAGSEASTEQFNQATK